MDTSWSKEEWAALWACIMVPAQLATYVMCAVRWFETDHVAFWHGFKELIWALIPIINFTYVWDWWLAFFLFLFALLSPLWDWPKSI